MLRKNHHFANTFSQALEHATQNVEEGNAASQEATVGTNQLPPPPPPVHEYIRLWEMTKKHKDNSWDKLAEQRLKEFKELHEQQLEHYGVDDLTVQEAYMKVLGASSGYINGLGFDPKPPRGRKEGRSDGEGIQIAHQIAQQLELLEKNSREREAQLKEQLEKDSREREDGLKGQIQRLQDDKVEMLREIEKLKQDAEAREERMNAEFRAMQQKVLSMCAQGQLNFPN